MASFFVFLNSYQDHIIASISIILGGLQASVSSWAIHRLILDEHFLMFVIGDVTRASSPNKDAYEKYALVMELLGAKTGMMLTLTMIKVAFSVALVSGILQILSSCFLLFMKSKHDKAARYLWTFCGAISAFLLASSFVILWLFWVKNIDYFQVSLSYTGVNFFVMAHLFATMAPAVILEIYTRFRKPDAQDETINKTGSSGSSKTGFSTASTSTTSLNTDVTSDKVEMIPKLVVSGNEIKHHRRSQSKITPLDISLPLPPPPPSPTAI